MHARAAGRADYIRRAAWSYVANDTFMGGGQAPPLPHRPPLSARPPAWGVEGGGEVSARGAGG
jgi:hypothetical protein